MFNNREQNYGFIPWDSIGENWYFDANNCLRIYTELGEYFYELLGEYFYEVILIKPY